MILAEYKMHDDPATVVQPGAEYRVRGPALHPVHGVLADFVRSLVEFARPGV